MVHNHLIFCVENNKADILLMELLLKEFNEKHSDSRVEIIFLENSVKAFDYLQEIQNKEGERIPDMFLLNINMPNMSGIQLLKAIRQMPTFYKVPIVMHTCVNLDTHSDILALGANAFLTKDREEGFIKTIDYWLNCHKKYCEIPRKPKNNSWSDYLNENK